MDKIRSGLIQSLLGSEESHEGPIFKNVSGKSDQGTYEPPGAESPRTVTAVPSDSNRNAFSSRGMPSNFTSPKSEKSSLTHREIFSGDKETSLLTESFGPKQKKIPIGVIAALDNERAMKQRRREVNAERAEYGRPLEFPDAEYYPPVYNESTGAISPGIQKKT